ncbi:kunitz-type protease inhibitor 2 isoform X1 [Dermochelys coriacea]|uniref:kunitz-type protease inhibitor 2 isoform X1 n=1 Tax=Dermochelys coriacea TaxID=27794 RepID=UPI001CA8D2DC|nr:kunitz-type protease inhibitor 2 isoform X1 [Dermochelys coriacea]
MGRAGLVLMLLAALGAGAWGHERLGEPAGSPAPGPPEFCLLPKVVGRCRAAFPRWWYNATSQACQRFTYGGCGANLNNFLVEADCQARCTVAADGKDVNEIPQASQRIVQSADEESPGRVQPANDTFTYEERCLAKAATGLCRASFPRWWFDVETKTCRQFTYGGCRGNSNNYLSEVECLARCSGESCHPACLAPAALPSPAGTTTQLPGPASSSSTGAARGTRTTPCRRSCICASAAGLQGALRGRSWAFTPPEWWPWPCCWPSSSLSCWALWSSSSSGCAGGTGSCP